MDNISVSNTVDQALIIKYKELDDKEKVGLLYLKKKLIAISFIFDTAITFASLLKWNLFSDNMVLSYVWISLFIFRLLFLLMSFWNVNLILVSLMLQIGNLIMNLFLNDWKLDNFLYLNLLLLLYFSAIHSRIIYYIMFFIILIVFLAYLYLFQPDYLSQISIAFISFLSSFIPLLYMDSEYRLVQLEKNRLKAEILSLQNQELISGWGEFFKSK